MKKIAALSALVSAVCMNVPAFADVAQITEIGSTTIKCEPVVQRNIIEAPDVATTTTVSTTKVDRTLVPTFQPSVFVINPPLALTSAPGVMIEVVRPDDLITRQAELNARILVEQAAGTLSAAKADNLLSRLNQVATNEANMKASGSMTWQQVEHCYRAFDRISHDLDNYSTDRNKAVAGSFLVL